MSFIRYYLSSLLSILFLNSCYCQWASRIKSLKPDIETAIDSDGCVAAVGFYDTNNLQIYDRFNILNDRGRIPDGPGLFAAKYDANGELQWTAFMKTLSSLDNNRFVKASFDSENNLIIVGYGQLRYVFSNLSNSLYFPHSIYSTSSIFMVKIDSQGNFKWAVFINTETCQISIDKTNNNIIVTGTNDISINNSSFIQDSTGHSVLASLESNMGFIVLLSSSGEYLGLATISNFQIQSSSIDSENDLAIIGTRMNNGLIQFYTNPNGSHTPFEVQETGNDSGLSLVAKYTISGSNIELQWISLLRHRTITQIADYKISVSLSANGNVYILLCRMQVEIVGSDSTVYTVGCPNCIDIVQYNRDGLYQRKTTVSDECGMVWSLKLHINSSLLLGSMRSILMDTLPRVKLPDEKVIDIIPGSLTTILVSLSENGKTEFYYRISDGNHHTFSFSSLGNSIALAGFITGKNISLYNHNNIAIMSMEEVKNFNFLMVFKDPTFNIKSFNNTNQPDTKNGCSTLSYSTKSASSYIFYTSKKLTEIPIVKELTEIPTLTHETIVNTTFIKPTKTEKTSPISSVSRRPLPSGNSSKLNNSVAFILIGLSLFCFLILVGTYVLRRIWYNRSNSIIKSTVREKSSAMKSSTMLLSDKTTALLQPQTKTSIIISETLSGPTPLSLPAFAMFQYGIDFRPEKTLIKNKEISVHIGSAYHPQILQVFGKTVIMKEYTSFRFNHPANSTFMQEVSFMYLLNDHKNIIKFIGFSQNPYCILMKYYPMGSLRKYLFEKQQKKTKRIQITIMLDISEGISFMASKGVAHCDLKPDNVLMELETSGRLTAVIADFGLTCLFNDESKQVAGFKLINARGFSLAYAAPECISRVRAGRKIVSGFPYHPLSSDIYSLGVTFHTVLTRWYPW